MAAGTVITFYSYKGGTGRSMSLANVAWILASNGSRVLVVDWDLEAPGLHRYFHPFLPDDALRSSRGVIDMMWEFAHAAMDPMASDTPDWHVQYARTSPYAVSVEHDFRGDGTIDLMPAGRQDDSYSALVSTFDWDNFYDRLGGGGFLEALKCDMRENYDYVLIDSRTGLSDTAGVCTVALPDIVVTCFTMSTQSIDGAAAVAASISHQRLNDLRILPVPMRVENGEHDKLETSRDYARHAFDDFLWHVDDVDRYWGQVEVPYRPYYAYEEILATVGDRPQQENTILAATERLVDHLTRGETTSLVAVGSEEKRRALLALFLRAKASEPTEQRPTRRDFKVFLTYPETSLNPWFNVHKLRSLRSLLKAQDFDVELDPDLRHWTAATGRTKLVVLEDTRTNAPRLDTGIDWDSDTVIRSRSDGLDPWPIDEIVDQLTKPTPVRVPPLSVDEWAWGQGAATAIRTQVSENLTLRASDVNVHETARLPIRWSAGGVSSSVQTLSDVFVTTPSKKLIILGEPGSGKSTVALLLARGLLAHAGWPVPILLSVATWRPTTEYFDDWVVRVIMENYALHSSTNLEIDMVRLVRLGAVVPVIDGLDELPAQEYEHALRQIVDTTAPVIATSRTAQYDHTASKLSAVRASVVELEPVRLDDALHYLSSNTTRRDHRTAEALNTISRNPDSALAHALKNPAMIILVRSYLDSPGADVKGLTAMESVVDLQESLLDSYTTEALGRRIRRPGEPDYSSPRTRHWLSFIADRPYSSIRWWELHKSVPPLRNRVALLILGLYTVMPPTLLLIFSEIGGKEVLSALLPIPLVLISAAAAVPPPISPIKSNIKYLSPTARRRAQLPEGQILKTSKSERFGAVLTITTGITIGAILFYTWVALLNGYPLNSSYAHAHKYSIALIGMWFGGAIGVAVAMTTAWSRYLTSRILLAHRKQLPWRLNHFLENAHRRGILQRIGAGAVYAFRDKRLADILAERRHRRR